MPSPSVIAHRQRRRTTNLFLLRRRAHFALLFMIFVDITSSVITTTTYPIPNKSPMTPELWHIVKYALVAEKTVMILANFVIAAIISTLRLQLVNCGRSLIHSSLFFRLLGLLFESFFWTLALLSSGVSMLNTFLAAIAIILYNLSCFAVTKYLLEESLQSLGSWLRGRQEVSVASLTVPEQEYELEPVYGTC